MRGCCCCNGGGGGDHGWHDGDDGELDLVLTLVGVLLLGVLIGRCHEIVLDGRGRGGC